MSDLEYQVFRTKPREKKRQKRKLRDKDATKIEYAPSAASFGDRVVADTDSTSEAVSKSSAVSYRRQLRQAKRDGDDKKIVTIMKMRELQRITAAATQDNEDDFRGEVPISRSALMKHSRTNRQSSKKLIQTVPKSLQSERNSRRRKHTADVMKSAVSQSIRSDAMLIEDMGYLEAEPGETTADISQHDIIKQVDVQSAQKHFTLSLKDYGPYHIDYSSNGRFLALAGKLGHAAVVDWQPKNLKCEFNVKETINDIKYLHNETMFAVAQRQWVYIYDNDGIELHCLKALDSPLQLQFLPYHFLLACSNSKGYVSWLDVSIGEKVSGFQTHRGRLGVMTQNPANAILHLAHSRGTVSLWSPNSKESLVEILCHDSAVRSVTVNKTGTYMATSGMDRKIKIWDLRKNYTPVSEFKVPAGASSLHFSSTGLLAASMGNTAYVYKDVCMTAPASAYMSHTAQGSIQSVRFCPYEDVLGVSSAGGYESLLIPGSGEANFDTMESNPYQTKKQRRAHEVKQLLDKIPHHLITLSQESMQKPKDINAVVEEKNHIPKRWLKYHYIPSKSVMESKRRWELRKKLAQDKIKRAEQHEKNKDKAYDPMARFKFGG